MITPHSAPLIPRWLAAVLVIYAIMAVIYSVSTPIFEPPDEIFHFPLIDHIADTGTLPVQDPEVETRWHQEGSQPPLYYALSALLVLPIDRGDLDARQERNPHARIGVGLATDNQVTVKHDWDAEAFPWSGTTLAVHVVRLFSVALSLGTVVAIYHVARLAAPGARAIHVTAVLLAAFNPMFLFISGAINNDNLINLFSAVTLALLLVIWRAGLSDRRLWILAAIMALASLSKLSGLALYPTAALVVLLVHVREGRSLRDLLRAGMIVLAVWAVLAGWWYARNLYLYGEPTGMGRMLDVYGTRGGTPTAGDLLDEFEGLRLSFWGVFGMLNVIAPQWLFDYTDALLIVALAGLLLGLMRVALARRARRGTQATHTRAAAWSLRGIRHRLNSDFWRDGLPVTILALHTLIVFAALINWTIRTPATQGRLLFPALGALATLIALGLAQVVPRRARHLVAPLFALPVVAAGIAIPFHTLRPTYARPPTVAAVPDDAIPVDARFGPIELRGVAISDHAPKPGDERDGLAITLYWRPTAHTASDMSFYVQVLGLPDVSADSGYQQIAKIDSYPGGGLLRTTTWQLDTIYADSYTLPVAADARTPVQPVLKIGWRQYETGMEFDPVTLDGAPRGPVTVQAGRIVGDAKHLAGGVPLEAVFGGALRLNRADVTPQTAAPGESISVALEWEALARVGDDFNVLVHLLPAPHLDPESSAYGQPAAQGDAPPRDGRWPTSAWAVGVPFVDTYTIPLPDDLPAGTYRVAAGLYRPADFSRLPVSTELDTLPGAAILPHDVTITG